MVISIISIINIIVVVVSEPTQPGSLISEPKKFESGSAHHELVG